MHDNRVMVLDLVSAEELMVHVVRDDELREQLAQAIWYAEEGGICNDVFLFENVSEFVVAARANSVDYLVR